MALPENAALRPIALSVLVRGTGSAADAAAIGAASRRAYEELTGILVPLIGQVGVDALTTRALNLANVEYPQGQAGHSEQAGAPFTYVSSWLEQQDPAKATDAAVAVLSALAGLLVAFIGEPLTMKLLRKAWPEGFTE